MSKVFQSSTLVKSIDSSDDIIRLAPSGNLPASGLLVIDRVDSNGYLSSSSTEYVSYNTTNGSTLLKVNRGVYGSGAQSHPTGAIVEWVFPQFRDDSWTKIPGEHSVDKLKRWLEVHR